ncbi:aldehyde dehydrogenase family protein, partial [Pseudomonas aeruginosa]|uniref:aldehyde dehydrogenase family protein n=1 Tax=Pseudomonas aeruginosa TaxID=287 RepID=UPI0013A5B4D4
MQNLLFIDGRFVPAVDRGEIEVLNPADGSSITRIAAAEAADVDLAVAAGRRAFPAWAGLPAAERGRMLVKLGGAIEANAEQLARLESLDTGHPLRDSRNLDVPRTAACFRYFG